MSNQEVPCAEGRRALVWCKCIERWIECTAAIDDDGRRVWLAPSIDECGEPDHASWWIDAEDAPTALLHNQCPECYEVGEHGAGCRIAENLRRGVPEFWARWAHNTAPEPRRGHTLLMLGGSGDTATVIARMVPCNDVEWESDNERWWLTEGAWKDDGYLVAAVCLGPDGAPTNEPWEA